MKTTHFRWNDVLYRRVEIDGNVEWYDVDPYRGGNVKLREHRASIIEMLYKKYPEYEAAK